MSGIRPPSFSRETPAACTLLLTAIAAVVLMAFHPTGRELHDAAVPLAVLWRNSIVHGLVILAVGLQTWGALALVRRLRSPLVGLAECAFVAQCFAALGATIAAICSGFVMNDFLVAGADGAGAAVGRDVIWPVNQAFAKVFTVAGSAAIAGWSLAGWRGGLHRATVLFGLVVGSAATLLVAGGHVRLHLHGMGAVVLAHEIWWVCVGVQLLRLRTGA